MSISDMLPDWLGRCADNFPDRLAIKYKDQSWSFTELDHRAVHMARQLATLGVREGKRVASLAVNSADYVVLVHALTKLGAVLVPLNIRLTHDELNWQLRDVQAEFLINDAQHAGRAAEIGASIPSLVRATFAHEALAGEVILPELPEAHHPLRSLIDLNATQVIMYTSGTTGTPKGVIITFGMQWWNAVGSALNLGHAQDDRWLACMPLFHIGGLSILMRSVIYGISVIVHEKFDAATVNSTIREDRITILSVVAVMLQRMLEASGQEQYPETLRCVLLGGGPAPHPLLEDCARRHIPVAQTYGLTESCSQAVTLPPADALRKLGSAGKPLLPVQLRIMREDGGPARANEPGIIYLMGPTITPGYDGRPDATAQAMHEGWFSTGDLGYLDDEGYLYVLDRRTDLIISGGENVYPAEIEAVLLAHPDVEDVGVCGIEDVQWGQVPVAFVRKRSDSTLSEEALTTYAASRLARYKLPKTIHFVDMLPRNSAGKLLRRELRQP